MASMTDRTSTPEQFGSAFADYLERLQAAWGDDELSSRADRCRAAMKSLLAATDPAWLAAMDRVACSDRPVELYRDRDAGFVQMAHPYPSGHASPPHGHGDGAWVVYGVQRGEVEIATYEQTGAEPPLKMSLSELLHPGDARIYGPGELHSVRLVSEGPEGGPGVVLRLLSEDLSKLDRPHYGWQDVAAFG